MAWDQLCHLCGWNWIHLRKNIIQPLLQPYDDATPKIETEYKLYLFIYLVNTNFRIFLIQHLYFGFWWISICSFYRHFEKIISIYRLKSFILVSKSTLISLRNLLDCLKEFSCSFANFGSHIFIANTVFTFHGIHLINDSSIAKKSFHLVSYGTKLSSSS